MENLVQRIAVFDFRKTIGGVFIGGDILNLRYFMI